MWHDLSQPIPPTHTLPLFWIPCWMQLKHPFSNKSSCLSMMSLLKDLCIWSLTQIQQQQMSCRARCSSSLICAAFWQQGSKKIELEYNVNFLKTCSQYLIISHVQSLAFVEAVFDTLLQKSWGHQGKHQVECGNNLRDRERFSCFLCHHVSGIHLVSDTLKHNGMNMMINKVLGGPFKIGEATSVGGGKDALVQILVPKSIHFLSAGTLWHPKVRHENLMRHTCRGNDG